MDKLKLVAMGLVMAFLAIRAGADDEAAFRANIEARKDKLLAAASAQGRVMTTADEIARAKRNVKAT